MHKPPSKTKPSPDVDSIHCQHPLADLLKNLEEKIESLSEFRIASMVDAIQLMLQNNQQRLMALEMLAPQKSFDVHSKKQQIIAENHYLAGTVLPMLYDRIQK